MKRIFRQLDQAWERTFEVRNQRTNLNRYQVRLEGKIIYRSKSLEHARAYRTKVLWVNPGSQVTLIDTHENQN
jgi:hypothetical protein